MAHCSIWDDVSGRTNGRALSASHLGKSAAHAARLLPALAIVPDVGQLAQDADALVLVTDWPEFRELSFSELARLMRCPLIVDGRNSLDREAVQTGGLEYIGIGR